MSDCESPQNVQLILSKQTKRDIHRCILCQRVKDSKGSPKLTSTVPGRQSIIDATQYLNDDILYGLEERELLLIQYHVKTCYANYLRSKKRKEEKQHKEVDTGDQGSVNYVETPEPSCSRAKRQNTVEPVNFREKPCVICNHVKSKGDNRRWRISERKRAKQFLAAYKFNKDSVYTRCSLLQTVGDLFAADVMYHTNCMSNYVMKFKRILQELLDDTDDLYIPYSIKQDERSRRRLNEGIKTVIINSEPHLPIDIDRFWSLDENKMNLQQFFIEWLIGHYSGHKPVYLGGAHPEDITSCVKILEGHAEPNHLLKCDHEEADDRILFHLSHAIKVDKYKKAVVASPDTDIFISALYHFSQWVFFGLVELWTVSGKSNTRVAVPIHSIFESMDANVVEVMSAVHALTECDTTSKVGTKSSAFNTAILHGYDLLLSFGKAELSCNMIASAEKFLVLCMSASSNFDTFDDMRGHIYHKKSFQLDLEKLPPTSGSIHQHIRRAYLQSYLWIHAPLVDSIIIDPQEYGYETCDDEHLSPVLVSSTAIHDDFPLPCNCIKCARCTICPCRVSGISCCKFCNCGSSQQCKNPNNLT